ncbi:MAG: SH3 domain-containing protein [Terrisporobacter sp.]|uniref:C40 family peptidase n=1 Tax=Terrisporobacter sp. TaxID=1965305 RepID=UPI00399B725D
MSINKNYVMAGMLATAVAIPLSDTTTSHASEIRTTTVRVHFRTGAGTNYSSMGILDKGVKVSYISESGNWTKVEYDSKTGYIYSDYLEKGESNATPTSTMYTTPEIGLNLRKGPGTSYSVIRTLSKGTAVTVHSSSNGWSKISVNGVEGYVSTSFLSSTNPSTNSSTSNETTSTPTTTMYVTPDAGLNLRKGAGTSYSVIKTLSKGTAVTVHSSNNGWSKVSVNGVEGYVSTSYLSSTKPSTSGSSSSSSSNSSTSVSVDKVLDFSHQQLGKPYVWGAQGPNSFDCSGLIYYVYKNAANITLPRTSVEQSKFGTTVSKSNLKAGDLVFFDTNGPNNGAVSHVGIYAGGGQLIHASSSNKKIVKVNMETSYWNNTYVVAKRVL